ncbi:MAG: hypothetical protein V3R66_04770, partial [Rhodospirillales bacterium]
MARHEVNYEVHVLQSGRWEIQARYPDHKENAAVEEAVTLGKVKGINGVRVIKEAYDPGSGVSKETVIYQHPRPDSGGAKPSPSQKPPPSTSSSWDDPSPPKQAPRKHTRTESLADDGDGLEMIEASKSKGGSGKKKSATKKSSLVSVIVKVLLIILASVVIGAVIAGMISVWLRDTSLTTNVQT